MSSPLRTIFWISIFEVSTNSQSAKSSGATLVRWFNMSWLVYAMGAMVVLVALHYAWHICEDVFLIRKSLWLEQNEKTVSRDD